MNTFLMVKKCSYCVSKVPNDDGPSMSIIEFCLSLLGSPGREALVGAIGLQLHFGHTWRVSRHFYDFTMEKSCSVLRHFFYTMRRNLLNLCVLVSINKTLFGLVYSY